jgi:hypothetical protein
MSKLFKEASKNGSFKGICLGLMFSITYLMFMDDVLIFYEDFRRIIKKIKILFTHSAKFHINLEKSTLSMWEIIELEKGCLSQLFPYQVIDMDQGIKYSKFHLKPNLYKKCDWKWLVSKVEK